MGSLYISWLIIIPIQPRENATVSCLGETYRTMAMSFSEEKNSRREFKDVIAICAVKT